MQAPPSTPRIRITADEINCLLYSYLKESGFDHSAFAVCKEAKLENSPYFQKHIPRGELIELLSKALLYVEVEVHWKTDSDSMTTTCKSGFSLLDSHVCSSEPAPIIPIPAISITSLEGKSLAESTKRKASPVASDGPQEKRSRTDDMELDGPSESKAKLEANSRPMSPEPGKKALAAKAPKPRTQGPVDDSTDPNAILLLPGHLSEVFVCAFNPKIPSLLATGSKDAVVKIWSLPDPNSPSGFAPPPEPPVVLDFGTKDGPGDLTSLHWNYDGSLLAIGSYDRVLRICTAKGQILFQHSQHQGPIFASRFSPSGRWVASSSLDGTACLWDVQKRLLVRQHKLHAECCLDVDWITDEIFGSCSANGQIHILSVNETDPLKVLSGHKTEINRMKVNPSGTRLASCSDDATARIWNVEKLGGEKDGIPGLSSSSDHVVVLSGHRHSVTTVAWCPYQPAGTSEMIATSSFDGTARFWDSATGECLHVFSDHRRSIYALIFSPDGQWLATGSGDGFLHIYNVITKQKRWSWFAGSDKPGVFEIDWQQQEDGLNRVALALECRQLAVIDAQKIPALRTLN
ncbi:WD40 repeat-like protein [Pluteus cervinus]|uniref:WD40 repeat-like protein n=1 Tax=Pluteus cervinus TaxID=181527 RepID=A0ACD3BHZ0_9AGAR|nr:WD40 repeat-like protein [Pluteus cervinus]